MDFELPADFKELLELLNRHEVKYLLIGGYAVGFHGYGRSTNDIDIVVADDAVNANRISRALEEFGFPSGTVPPELFTRKNSLVVIGVEPLAVDILNYFTGVGFESAYQRKRAVQCENITIDLVAFDDLIANKRAVGRYKDLADIEYLERIKSKTD